MEKLSLQTKKLIVILGVVGVSFSAILVKAASAPSMVLVLYRMLFAALMLTIPCLRQTKGVLGKIPRTDWFFCLISGFFLALHFTCYFEAIRYTSIASAVLLVDTEVFFVSFILLFCFHERIPAKGWLGILITFAGSAIVAVSDAGGGSDILKGDVIALTGAACMSVYTIMGKLCRRSMTTTLYTTAVYWIAGLTSLVILLLRGVAVTGYTRVDLLCALGMAVFCTLLGHSVFSWGLKYVSASFISTAKLMEPVFASILALLIFGQVPAWTTVLGGAVIIAGIYLYSIQKEQT